uniref:Profilin n=1 Tax=Mesocestoides corti TaxID=53468 RepID=A0A5K3ERP8_MESCO
MSWDAILNSMLQYPKPSQEDILKIVKVASSGQNESVSISGKKLITVRCGGNELSATGSEYAIHARVLTKAVVIAANSDPKNNPGVNCLLSTASCATANHLASSGF